MRVRVTESFKTPKRTFHPGQIIDIPDSILAKLSGKVVPVPFDEAQGRSMMRKLITDLNRHRWPETAIDLPTFDQIDAAFLAGDMAALRQSIENYRQAALAALTSSTGRPDLWRAA